MLSPNEDKVVETPTVEKEEETSVQDDKGEITSVSVSEPSEENKVKEKIQLLEETEKDKGQSPPGQKVDIPCLERSGNNRFGKRLQQDSKILPQSQDVVDKLTTKKDGNGNDEEELRNLELGGYVGFDSLPDRYASKAKRKGFVFNILCIGETGIGKTTLMNSLFNTHFEEATPSSHDLLSIHLKSQTYEIQESNVKMNLTIAQTIGFGDQINKEDSCKSIVTYVDDQFEAYFKEETKLERCLESYHDTRIHACLYFICPTGHGLKSIDIECLKGLDTKVNIIPLIAKADTISGKDLLKFKENIVRELESNLVKIYKFPTDDESVGKLNTPMNFCIPFAVVGSTDYVQVGTRNVRGRQYPWGVVEIENDNHCDFVKLREMLIRTNMEDMRETTHSKHYELYRKTRLEQMGFSDQDAENKPITFQQSWERKMLLHQQKLDQREKELNKKLRNRYSDKDDELKEQERELMVRFDEIKLGFNNDRRRYEEYEHQMEKEISEFQRIKLEYSSGLLLSGSSRRHTLSLGSLKSKKKKDKQLLSAGTLGTMEF